MKRLSTFAVSCAALGLVPALAFAQSNAKNNNIARFVLHDDSYIAGSTIATTQEIRGDAYIVGGQVSLGAPVGKDLHVAGGSIQINSPVRDDLRAAGGNVSINQNITGDVVVFGGDITIRKGVTIDGDVLLMGGNITMDGVIRGSLTTEGGNVTVNGTVNGAGTITAGKTILNGRINGTSKIASNTFVIGNTGIVANNLEYWNEGGTQNFGNKVRGKSVFNPDLERKDNIKASPTAASLLAASLSLTSILSAALVIVLMLLLTKTFFRDTTKNLMAKPGWSFLIGLLYFILTPVAGILLILTVIGLPVGLLFLASFVFTLLFIKPLTALIIVRASELYYKKKWTTLQVFFLSVLAYIVLKLLCFIPFVGWLAVFLIVCTALGALLMTKYEKYRKIM